MDFLLNTIVSNEVIPSLWYNFLNKKVKKSTFLVQRSFMYKLKWIIIEESSKYKQKGTLIHSMEQFHTRWPEKVCVLNFFIHFFGFSSQLVMDFTTFLHRILPFYDVDEMFSRCFSYLILTKSQKKISLKSLSNFYVWWHTLWTYIYWW